MRHLLTFFTLLSLAALLATAVVNHPFASATAGRPVGVQNDGAFFDSGQSLGNANSHGVALGDLTGNGFIDAFVANGNGPAPNRAWLNNGAGFFSSNGQSLGSRDSQAVALGDLNGNGHLDAVVANSDGLNQVWLNEGNGQFTAGQAFDNSVSRGVALGDLDGDGYLDVVFANNGGNTIWFNNGDGTFSDSGQNLGTFSSYDVALADLNGNGSLDAFFANGLSGPQPDEVWFNDGNGAFSNSGQALGSAWSYAVALGDLTGNGYIDAFTASWFPNANKVWLNNGSGVFTDSGQALGDAASLGVSLADVNEDNALDAIVANNSPDGVQVWLNDGNGAFADSGQTLGETTTYAVALADLDGDGDLDIFAANFGPNKVWLNGAPGLPTAVFDVERTVNDDGEEVTYWATSGNAALPVLLSRPAPQAIDVYVQIVTPGGVITELMPFASGEQLKLLNVVNPNPDPDARIELRLSVTLPGVAPGPADVTDELLLVFVDGEQGMKGCILCYVEWLGRLVGVDSTFGLMHHLDLPEQEESPQWDYYTALFKIYSPELSAIVATSPSLLWASITTLDEWAPAAQSLSDGSSAEYMVSSKMAGDAENLFNGVKAKASPGLQALIQQEQAALDIPSFAGMTMDEAWAAFQEKRPISQLYLTIILK